MDFQIKRNPVDAKKRTLQEAFLFNDQVISHWKPASEVWPFSYGDDILGCLSSLGSFFLTYAFRKELKIRPYARLTCYSPAMALPAIGCAAFHNYVITTDLLTASECPLCITTKASIGQGMLSIAFPLIVAPTVCFFMADRLLTYPVPPLVKAPKEAFLLFQKIVKKHYRPFLVMGAINTLAASIITYHKYKTLFKIGFLKKK